MSIDSIYIKITKELESPKLLSVVKTKTGTYHYSDADQSILHRDNGPAIEWINGSQEWFQQGVRHRNNGPAVVWAHGGEKWYQNGQLHRSDGPAAIDALGNQLYYLYDQLIDPIVWNNMFELIPEELKSYSTHRTLLNKLNTGKISSSEYQNSIIELYKHDTTFESPNFKDISRAIFNYSVLMSQSEVDRPFLQEIRKLLKDSISAAISAEKQDQIVDEFLKLYQKFRNSLNPGPFSFHHLLLVQFLNVSISVGEFKEELGGKLSKKFDECLETSLHTLRQSFQNFQQGKTTPGEVNTLIKHNIGELLACVASTYEETLCFQLQESLDHYLWDLVFSAVPSIQKSLTSEQTYEIIRLNFEDGESFARVCELVEQWLQNELDKKLSVWQLNNKSIDPEYLRQKIYNRIIFLLEENLFDNSELLSYGVVLHLIEDMISKEREANIRNTSYLDDFLINRLEQIKDIPEKDRLLSYYRKHNQFYRSFVINENDPKILEEKFERETILDSLVYDFLGQEETLHQEFDYLHTPVKHDMGETWTYMIGDQRHSTDGPAVIWKDGSKTEWWFEGQRHRTNGPAIECRDGSKYWYQQGKLHREDGPAVSQADGVQRWYLHGEELTKMEWEGKITDNGLDEVQVVQACSEEGLKLVNTLCKSNKSEIARQIIQKWIDNKYLPKTESIDTWTIRNAIPDKTIPFYYSNMNPSGFKMPEGSYVRSLTRGQEWVNEFQVDGKLIYFGSPEGYELSATDPMVQLMLTEVSSSPQTNPEVLPPAPEEQAPERDMEWIVAHYRKSEYREEIAKVLQQWFKDGKLIDCEKINAYKLCDIVPEQPIAVKYSRPNGADLFPLNTYNKTIYLNSQWINEFIINGESKYYSNDIISEDIKCKLIELSKEFGNSDKQIELNLFEPSSQPAPEEKTEESARVPSETPASSTPEVTERSLTLDLMLAQNLYNEDPLCGRSLALHSLITALQKHPALQGTAVDLDLTSEEAYQLAKAFPKMQFSVLFDKGRSSEHRIHYLGSSYRLVYSDGTTYRYQNGKLHCLDGPAVEAADGRKEYWLEGVLIDVPEVEPGKRHLIFCNANGNEYQITSTNSFFKATLRPEDHVQPSIIIDGEKLNLSDVVDLALDREVSDNPSVEAPTNQVNSINKSTTFEYKDKDGNLQTEQVYIKTRVEEGILITEIFSDPEYKNLHCISQPAYSKANGDKTWYFNNCEHREGGPADENSNRKIWYQHGSFHREDGPAIEYSDGKREYWLNSAFYDNPEKWKFAVKKLKFTQKRSEELGLDLTNIDLKKEVDIKDNIKYYFLNKNGDQVLHRADGPAFIGSDGTKKWFLYGKLHREDGPAYEFSDGRQAYFQFGEKHRVGGPAEIDGDRQFWFQNNQLHREDGPAYTYGDKGQEWWVNGESHRDYGPACIWTNGTQKWLQHGKLHNMYGPARVWGDENLTDGREKEEYWLDNQQLSQEEWEAKGGHRLYYKDQCFYRDSEHTILHRLDGPAIAKDDYFAYYWNGLLHRDGGAAVMNSGENLYYRYGVLHREDGPAAVYRNGVQEYWLDGQKFDSKEAWEAALPNKNYVEFRAGSLIFFKDKELTTVHRENDLPAQISFCLENGKIITTKTWYKDNKIHREGGPAAQYSNGSQTWNLNGKLHRKDGPAVEIKNSDDSWTYKYYLDDQELTEAEWKNKIYKPSKFEKFIYRAVGETVANLGSKVSNPLMGSAAGIATGAVLSISENPAIKQIAKQMRVASLAKGGSSFLSSSSKAEPEEDKLSLPPEIIQEQVILEIPALRA